MANIEAVRARMRQLYENLGWRYNVLADRWVTTINGKEVCGRLDDDGVMQSWPAAYDVRWEEGPVSENVDFQENEPSLLDAQAAQRARDDAYKKRVEEEAVWIEEQAEEEAKAVLRDMFAMHALPLVFFSSDPKGTALRAYEYADAMMVAREMKK